MLLIVLQVSVLGFYLPPLLSGPQIIISLPVQIATWVSLALGTLVILVGVQVSSAQFGFGVGVAVGVGEGVGNTGVNVAVAVGVQVAVAVAEAGACLESAAVQ